MKTYIMLCKKAIEISLSFLLRPFVKLVPKDDQLWVFGAGSGKLFMDNSKYLFLHVRANHPEIRAIWLSKSNDVVKMLAILRHEAYLTHSLHGIWFSLRAGCAIMSQGSLDIDQITVTGAKNIQLWHGIPLKRVMKDDKLSHKHTPLKTSNALVLSVLSRGRHYAKLADRSPDRIISCSEEDRQTLCSAFGVPRAQVVVTGSPRNDALFRKNAGSSHDAAYIRNLKSRFGYKHLIVYLPTFRDSRIGSSELFTRFGFSVEEVEKTLYELNALLIIKSHYFDPALSEFSNIQLSRIIIVKGTDIADIYPILSETDILITDYSSVYFDFLLLDRPIIFTPFDLKEYIANDRELYYDYDEVTPGPKAKDWPEVLTILKQILEKDIWKDQRVAVCNRFHQYVDGNSSERVYQLIKSLAVSQKVSS
jgi:CDP-glycerol glycerophosphotransferase (TagB/SpsB family)